MMNKNSVSRGTRLPMGQIVEYLEDQPGHIAEIELERRRIL